MTAESGGGRVITSFPLQGKIVLVAVNAQKSEMPGEGRFNIGDNIAKTLIFRGREFEPQFVLAQISGSQPQSRIPSRQFKLAPFVCSARRTLGRVSCYVGAAKDVGTSARGTNDH